MSECPLRTGGVDTYDCQDGARGFVRGASGTVSSGVDAMREGGRWTYATVEYLGLVSYHLLKKGGKTFSASVVRMSRVMGNGVGKSFVYIKGTWPTYAERRRDTEGKFRSLQEKILMLEERLALLEVRGIRPSEKGLYGAKRKELEEGKRALLHQIMEANKRLLEEC